MGGFKVGHKKVGGRVKGTKNKNVLLKERISDFLTDKFDDFVKDYDSLSPKERTRLYTKMVEFSVPKVSAIKFEDIKNANNAIELLKIAAQYKDG